MLVLDTNVISEVMKGRDANPLVIVWLRTQSEPLVTTVISRAEIMAGIDLLPEGQRKNLLSQAATRALAGLGTCLPLTEQAADIYGQVVTRRARAGKPIGAMDALIAAITLEAKSTLVTRNTADFDDLGLDIINPWESSR